MLEKLAPHTVLRGGCGFFPLQILVVTLAFYKNLLIETPQGNWEKLQLEAIQEYGKGYIVKVADVQDRDAAALLTNANVAIAREELPPFRVRPILFCRSNWFDSGDRIW